MGFSSINGRGTALGNIGTNVTSDTNGSLTRPQDSSARRPNTMLGQYTTITNERESKVASDNFEFDNNTMSIFNKKARVLLP